MKENFQPLDSLLKNLDLTLFLDAMTIGVLLMDKTGRVVMMNRFLEALTGYRREEIIGVFGENVIRSNLSSQGDPVGKAFKSGDTIILEGDIINRNRKKNPIRFTISPLWLTSGEKAGVIIVLEDISLLKDLDDKIHGFSGQEKIIGHSRKMQEIFELLPVAAKTDASVLITGETGTGKDHVAESIHKASNRARHPFVKVNCGALPESLLESELFGHTRGAFTGADKDKPGMFRLAHGGTIYLTEIGDLSLHLQVKLLTVLDDKEFFPVGGSQKIKVDVRVIAATHRDLNELVRQGKFRDDLFYRLNVLRLHLPPLREREDDFRLLLDHFLRKYNAGLKKNIHGFSEEALAVLSSYSYPGNIRELRNIVEYAANICPDKIIRPEHLPKMHFAVPQAESAPADHGIRFPENAKAMKEDTERATGSLAFGSSGWGEIEKEMIMEALLKTGGNRSKAAEILGWSRSKLWRKIKCHALE